MKSKPFFKALLINPPGVALAYRNAPFGAEGLSSPPLALLQLAACSPKHTKIDLLDLDLDPKDWEARITSKAIEYNPDLIGITGDTPMAYMMRQAAQAARQGAPDALLVCGGVHASLFPEEMLQDKNFDMDLTGEADMTFQQLLSGVDPASIPGAAFIDENGEIRINVRAPLIKNLNDLPIPRYEAAQVTRYKGSYFLEDLSPSAYIESSRGCPNRCSYCNRTLFGGLFRPKSPERVVEEVFYARNAGYAWVHFIDDAFGQDPDRLIAICALLAKEKIMIPWTAFSGVHADLDVAEVYRSMAAAGCRKTAFGIESGSGEVLCGAGKQTDISAISKSVNAADAAGLETIGYFMLGLPDETTKDIDATIRLARSLPLTYAKFVIVMPYPGTALYNRWEREGRIISRDWRLYLFHNIENPPYRHPHMGVAEIRKFYFRAYRRFYFRLGYIWKRFKHALAKGSLLRELKIVSKIKWFKS